MGAIMACLLLIMYPERNYGKLSKNAERATRTFAPKYRIVPPSSLIPNRDGFNRV